MACTRVEVRLAMDRAGCRQAVVVARESLSRASACLSTSRLGEASGRAAATARTASGAAMPHAMRATMLVAGERPRPAWQWMRTRPGQASTWAGVSGATTDMPSRIGPATIMRPQAAVSRSRKRRGSHGPGHGRVMGRAGLWMLTTRSGRQDARAAGRASMEAMTRVGVMARLAGRRALQRIPPRGRVRCGTGRYPRGARGPWASSPGARP